MMAEEVAPALPDLPVADYWRACRARFANPRLDHRLTQIGEDGSSKLAQRLYPLIIANARAGRPTRRMAAVVRGWLGLSGRGGVKDPRGDRLASAAASACGVSMLLDDPSLFPDAFRLELAVRLAMTGEPA
jgi:fructuronate reductase